MKVTSISVTLSYELRSSPRRGYLRLLWSLRDTPPDFHGFVLLADHSAPPQSIGQGLELYRWQPEKNGNVREYEDTLSLQPIREKTHWEEFYCRLVLLEPGQNHSVTIIHPNTCQRISVEGRINGEQWKSVKYQPGIPKEVTCPFCFETFKTIDMLYSHGKDVDPEPGQYRWYDKLFGIRSLKPPLSPDGHHTIEKLCPNGHCLPVNTGLQDTFFIEMLGSTTSGKSTLIASLIKSLQSRLRWDFNFSFIVADEGTDEVYKQSFYEPLFIHKYQLDLTLHMHYPLVYNLRPTYKSRREKQRSVNIVFRDKSHQFIRYHSTTVEKCLNSASGYIILIDPLGMPEVCNKLPDLLRKGIYPEMMSKYVLDNILFALTKTGIINYYEGCQIPFAVVINKCDLLLDNGLINKSRLWCRDVRHVGCFNKVIHDDMAGMMEELVMQWDYPLYNTIKHYLPNHAFFGVSATGCQPDQYGRYPHISPWRVEDPILWLLAKLGVLPVQSLDDY